MPVATNSAFLSFEGVESSYNVKFKIRSSTIHNYYFMATLTKCRVNFILVSLLPVEYNFSKLSYIAHL